MTTNIKYNPFILSGRYQKMTPENPMRRTHVRIDLRCNRCIPFWSYQSIITLFFVRGVAQSFGQQEGFISIVRRGRLNFSIAAPLSGASRRRRRSTAQIGLGCSVPFSGGGRPNFPVCEFNAASKVSVFLRLCRAASLENRYGKIARSRVIILRARADQLP